MKLQWTRATRPSQKQKSIIDYIVTDSGNKEKIRLRRQVYKEISSGREHKWGEYYYRIGMWKLDS